MQLIPVKTRMLQPPQDNLFEVMDESLSDFHENDVLVVTSKVVSIHEGRCIKIEEGVDKEELVKSESDFYIDESDSRWRIVIKGNTLLVGAGIDESNADDHYILLPSDPFKSARVIRSYLAGRFGLQNLGVVIVDSHSIPLRYGTVGVALGWWGIEPVTHFTGQPDLFGRRTRFTRINVVDALASSTVFMMGEVSEQTPLCVVRNAPHIEFVDRDTSGNLFIPHREDIYWPLIKRFHEGND